MIRFAALASLTFTAFGLNAPASAVPMPIFTETFESGPVTSQLDAPTVGQFMVTEGTVDYIRTPNGFSIESCGAGGTGCVDLAGSTGAAASRIATDLLNFQPGSYVLSFDVSGNQRNASDSRLNVLIPGVLLPFLVTRNGAEGFTTISLAFVVTVATSASIAFEGLDTSDNIGLLLDNIALSFEANVVPLPGAMPLLLAGVAGLAFAARRPRRH